MSGSSLRVLCGPPSRLSRAIGVLDLAGCERTSAVIWWRCRGCPLRTLYSQADLEGGVRWVLVRRGSVSDRPESGWIRVQELGPEERGRLEQRCAARWGACSPLRADGERPSAPARTLGDRALVAGVRRFAAVPSVRDREGWADFLSPYFAGGACNLTGTYSDEYGYGHGCMHVRNVSADFRRFCAVIRRDSAPACVGIEVAPQGASSGRSILHFHAMIGGEFSDCDLAYVAWAWGQYRGWARAKAVVDKAGCVAYAAKHLLKQGSADNFAFWIGSKAPRSRHERRLCFELGSASSVRSYG